jgi:hypothetical protein
MIGMSVSQLDLMFEYIDLKSEISTHSSAVRMSEIRQLLLGEAFENEKNRQRIVESLKNLGKREVKLQRTLGMGGESE